MKKFFKITFFVSLALILLSCTLIAASAISSANSRQGSVGIIGGADGPTAIFVTQSLVFLNPMFDVLCIAGVVFIASAIGWIVMRKKQQEQ